jgi:NAD+ dependent glucose-6-phosphate dehydrogenase
MESQLHKVLITGANGLIGNLLYAALAARPEVYAPYGLVRRRAASKRVVPANFYPIPADRLHLADLADFGAVEAALQGIDTVVHMAADASGGSGWESVLQNNIIGTHNVFEASRRAEVKRVIFASTNQVVFGYRMDEPYKSLFAADRASLTGGEFPAFQPILADQPARPLNDYACSKVYGEALAHMYAFTHGLSCLCLRIGWVTPDNRLPSRILWCSQRDIVQLVERCIQAPDSLRFDIFFGQSDNPHNLVDIQHAMDVLGYQPQDQAEETS